MYLEHLSFSDALYASSGVVTTVGLVIVPKTPAGRAFTAVYNVVSLGLGVLLLAEIADARRAWMRRVLVRVCAHPHTPSSASRSLTADVLVLTAATIPTILIGAAVFCALESWTFPESVYFCVITASGLGMGDVEPLTQPGRVFFVGYIWITMGVMLSLLGTMGHAMHELLHKWTGAVQVFDAENPPAPSATTGAPLTLPGPRSGVPSVKPPTTDGHVSPAPDDFDPEVSEQMPLRRSFGEPPAAATRVDTSDSFPGSSPRLMPFGWSGPPSADSSPPRSASPVIPGSRAGIASSGIRRNMSAFSDGAH